MKMTPKEFNSMKKKFEDMRHEGFEHGQAELAESIIEHLQELNTFLLLESACVIRKSDFIGFSNRLIKSLKTYLD